MRTAFDTLDEFYAAEPERRRSPERDFGVWWRAATGDATWRISWLFNTGEVYAVCLGAPERGRWTDDNGAYMGEWAEYVTVGTGNGPVRVLGIFLSQAEVEAVFAGWAAQTGHPGSLEWAARACSEWVSA